MNRTSKTNRKSLKGTFAANQHRHMLAWIGGIFFAMAICINGYNGVYYDTLGEDKFFLVLAIYFVVTTLVLYGLFYYTVHLDGKYSWHGNALKRLFYQAAFCLGLPLVILVLAHKMMANLLPDPMLQSEYLRADAFLILIFFVCVNGSLLIVYLLNLNKRFRDAFAGFRRRVRLLLEQVSEIGSLKQELWETQHKLAVSEQQNRQWQEAYKSLQDKFNAMSIAEQKAVEPNLHVVETKKKLAGYEDAVVALFRGEGEIIYIGLRNGKESFYRHGSIKRLLEDLDEELYMQVNRNFVIHIDAVDSAVQVGGREIIITLNDSKSTQIVSYKEAPLIKYVRNRLLKKVKVEKMERNSLTG